jgi:hypothetical protein
MKTFSNLRLSARLGAAFGFLVLALVVTAVVGLKGVGARLQGHGLTERGSDLAIQHPWAFG